MRTKLFTLLLIIATIISINSCKEIKVTAFKPVKTIDLSDLGNINALHVFNSRLYALDASYSTLYQVDKGKPQKILKVPISHRAFLLDFALENNQAWFVNTYDEIFKTDLHGKMLDTIIVSRPDKIMLADNKIYITERFPTGNNLKLICATDSATEILTPEVSNYQPQKVGDCFLSYQNKLYLLSASLHTLFTLENDNLFSELKIQTENGFTGFYPGRFFIKENSGVILGTMNGKNYLALFEIKNKILKPVKILEIASEIDLTISEITDSKIYLYDYLNKQILVYNWPEI